MFRWFEFWISFGVILAPGFNTDETKRPSRYMIKWLKQKGSQSYYFVFPGHIRGCDNDKLRCSQWLQSNHHDMYKFQCCKITNGEQCAHFLECHWNRNVVIMMTFSALIALEIAKMTTSDAVQSKMKIWSNNISISVALYKLMIQLPPLL